MTKRKSYKALALLLASTATLAAIFAACLDDMGSAPRADNNFIINLDTRSGDVPSQLSDMRLFTFHDNGGAPNDGHFHREVVDVTRTSSSVSAWVETGNWHMALVSPPAGISPLTPVQATDMSETPMYVYNPTYNITAGKSDDASEFFLANEDVTITTAPQTIQTVLQRTVAKVTLILEEATANFEQTGHEIMLYDVPTTISYTGALLPDKATPVVTADPLRAALNLTTHATKTGYLCAAPVEFIIPAYQSRTQLSNDTATHKMRVGVKLKRVGGQTFFEKTADVRHVAHCNKELRIFITVNDGIQLQTEVLRWDGLNVSKTVGDVFNGWIYVKQNGTGSGTSWSDPLGTINDGINAYSTLKSAGIAVHGILVAGGAQTYAEEVSLSDPTAHGGSKLFGGWAGTPGTELADNALAPYQSTDRDLKNFKARLNTGTRKVLLNVPNTVLDGFIISGTASSTDAGLVIVGHQQAWINAVEIDQQIIAAQYALAITSGIATNVLASRNNKGVQLSGAFAKLVNATIVCNTAASFFNGELYNTVYWDNTGGMPSTVNGIIKNCAFEGAGSSSMPSGSNQENNYPLHSTNDAWFSGTVITIPGPHFNIGNDSSVDYFSFGTVNPNRSPLLGRGEQSFFDAVSGNYKTDINGNPRHHEGTDIGCYESAGAIKGFKFQWNMSDVYISPKVSIESDHPALLFDNSENVYVAWEMEATSIISNRYSVVAGHTSGNGNSVNLGYFRLKSGTTSNTGSTDLNCGTLLLRCTNLDRAYFPNTTMTVFQSPTTPVVWTEGYAGSFHKAGETGPRYVFGTNSGAWTARIISGHEWIKIDGKPRPADPYNDTEVEEAFGGMVTGTGNIVFRVGMKSTLPNAESQPRYGLISITRTASGKTGVALFFVRQGEAADYLYGPNDHRPLGARTEAIKFSPYNLTDQQGRFAASGVDLGKNGGNFVDYPSKTGYFFKWNDTKAFYPDKSLGNLNLGTGYRSGNWNADFDPCPLGYFTPTDPQWVHSYFLNRAPGSSGAGSATGTTFVWGRLADGYYDKLASTGGRELGGGPDRATEGLLMYNDYNNASVFFPMAGYSNTTGLYLDGSGTTAPYIQWTQTSSPRAATTMWHTHSYGEGTTGHLGMSCTGRNRSDGLTVRCVKN